ncbi:MAG: hypothetical protein J5606_09235 [Bacteroidales bacterium]|nr:hypothetical protein [Bacteroidales bacterium]
MKVKYKNKIEMTIKKFLLIASVVLISMASIFAQSPQGFTYQAVVREANGKLITNTPIGVRMTILQGSSTGREVYSDEYHPYTNANGLFTIVIGNGMNSINVIDWTKGPYFLKSEIDPSGSNNYTISTVQQLLSVPYALHAQTASNVSGGINYDSITNKPTNISYFTNDAGYLTSYTEKQKLSDVAALGDSVNTQIKNLSDPTDSLDAVNLRTLNMYWEANIATIINKYDSIINNLNRTIDTLRQTSLPMVITADVSDMTSETATLGGSVVYSGHSAVTARGVCWSTSSNPTISNSHTTDGIGVGNFTNNITGLTAGTTYYVRAYATNSAGTAYGNQVSFTTSSVLVNVPFSVSATDSVYFSPGNLQWSATNGGSTYTTHTVAGGGTAAGTWRFAPNQWDTIGANNKNISSTYSGWIDMFGWGTSGYNNKYPYMTSTTETDYGNGYNNISGTNYDWGLYNAIYNPITQTTDAPGTWRTLTIDEWVYLMNTRSTSSGVRYAKANVMGIDGVIIVPDDWSTSVYALQSANTADTAYTTNIINYADWIKIENAGCVFLPAAGYRDGALVYTVGTYGYYWSATYNPSTSAYRLFFNSSTLNLTYYSNHYYGNSVRLVRSAR